MLATDCVRSTFAVSAARLRSIKGAVVLFPGALVAGPAVAIYPGQPAHAQRWCDFLRGARINSHGSTFSAPASRSSTVMVADTSARSIDPR
jgi:hypothetical protein